MINLTFQTSDLAKLALFMYLGRMLSRKRDVIKDFRKGFLRVIIKVVIVCMLVATYQSIYKFVDWCHEFIVNVYRKGKY